MRKLGLETLHALEEWLSKVCHSNALAVARGDQRYRDDDDECWGGTRTFTTSCATDESCNLDWATLRMDWLGLEVFRTLSTLFILGVKRQMRSGSYLVEPPGILWIQRELFTWPRKRSHRECNKHREWKGGKKWLKQRNPRESYGSCGTEKHSTDPSPCVPLSLGECPPVHANHMVLAWAGCRRITILARRIVSELNLNTPLPLHQTLTHIFLLKVTLIKGNRILL